MESHSGDSKKPSAGAHHAAPKPHAHANPTQLLSSAKVVAAAAKSTLRHDNEKVDKAKVAGAAADLLGAASHYGKLEEKSYGKYVQQAESYLHRYGNPSSQQPADHASADAPAAAHASSAHPAGDQATAHSEGGFGDYMKMAQGFLKKH